MSRNTLRPETRGDVARLQRENESLRRRLEDAEATLRALSAGEVDAVLVAERDRVLTLEAPDVRYRLAVEQMPHPAVTLRDDGTIIYANHRFAEQLGMVQSELTGQALVAFVRPASRAAFEQLLREAGTDPVGCAQADIALEAQGARPLTVCLSASLLHGGALGSCVVVTDVTLHRQYEELRRTQDALRASEEQLREADRRKDEFVATLAHELRNPLLPMRNAVELLGAMAAPAPEIAQARGVLARQVRIMARLLDDLLDVARIARHTLDLRLERVALPTVLEAALETSRPLINARRHALMLALPAEPIYVRADPDRLSQVFANLLTNAAKYTEPDGRIELTVRRDGRQVSVSIKDTGIGISAEMLPRIFEIFTQASQAIDRSQGGLGIGLSLVKGLVDLHGGHVEVKSDGLGQGSEFIVHLPLDDASNASA